MISPHGESTGLEMTLLWMQRYVLTGWTLSHIRRVIFSFCAAETGFSSSGYVVTADGCAACKHFPFCDCGRDCGERFPTRITVPSVLNLLHRSPPQLMIKSLFLKNTQSFRDFPRSGQTEIIGSVIHLMAACSKILHSILFVTAALGRRKRGKCTQTGL